MMNQVRFYQYTTLGLLLLNGAVLGFFLLTKPTGPPPHSSNPFLDEAIEMLHLDQEQSAAFKTMAEAHNQNMEAISQQQQTLLLPYFESLFQPTGNMDTDSILSRYQQLEGDKVAVTYQHFQKIKSLLKPEQSVYFEAFMQKSIRLLLLKTEKNPPPPKDFR